MARPERRTRVDIAVSIAIAVVVLIAGVAVWNGSSARKAQSEPGPARSTFVAPLTSLPNVLRPAWNTTSDRPLLTLGGTAVTTRGGEVSGLDPATGSRAWRYSRDRQVCGLTSNSGMVLALYPDDRGCGEITALDAVTGARRYTRSGQEKQPLTLISDGSYLAAQSSQRVDVFRSDLVLTTQYGRPDVAVNTGVQPRAQCTIDSAMPSSSAVAVIEQCPNEPSPRLTFISAAPKEADRPQETSSVVAPGLGSALSGGDGAAPNDDRPRLLAATGSAATAYVPAQNGAPARVVTLGADGGQVRATDITTSPGGAPRDVEVATDAGTASFFTGTSTVVIDTTSLNAEMVIPGSLGPGVVLGNQIVVPGPTSLTAYDLDSRALVSSVPVQRDGYSGGPILLATSGQSLISQWGTTVQAYAP